MKTSNMLFNKLAMVILIIAFSVQNETSYAQYEEEVETTNGQNQQDESVDHSSPQQTAPSQSETSIRPEDAPATSQIILPREDARDGHFYSPFYRGYNLDHALAQLRGEMPWKSSEWSSGVTRQVMLDSRKMQIQRYVDAGLMGLPGGSTTVTDEHVQYALKNGKMYQPTGQFGNTGWDEKTGRSIPYFEPLNGSTTIFGFSFPGSKYNFALLKMGTGTTEGRVKNPCVNPGEMITPNPEYAPPITKVETITQTEVYERVDTAFVHTTDTLIQTVETERVEFVEVPTYVPSQGGAMMSGGFSMGMSAGFIGPQQPGYIDNSFYYVDNSYVDNTYIEGDTYITNPPPPVDPGVVPPTGNPTLPPNYPPSDENPQPPTDGNDPEPVGHNPWTDGIPVPDPIDGTGGGPTYGGGKGKGNNSSPSVALEGTFFSPGVLANTASGNSIPKPMAPKENNGPAKGDILSVQSDPKPMNPKGSILSAPIKGNTPKSENTLAFNGPPKGNTPSSTYSDPRPMNSTTAPVKDNVPQSNIIPPSKPVTPKTHTPIQVKDNTPKSNISNPDPRPMNPVTASNQGTPSKPNTGGWGYSDFSGGTKDPSRGNTSGVIPKGNNNNSTPRSETPSIATPKNNPETTTENARVAGGTKSVKQSVRPDRGNNPQVKKPAKKNSQIKSKPRQQPKVAKSAPKSKPQARPKGGSQSRTSRQR